MNSSRFDLLRHGHCEGGNIFRGHCDSVLSSQGQLQMQRAIKSLGQEQDHASTDWDIIISSPSKRCHNFAQQLAQQLEVPIEVEPALKEIFFGDWEGQEISAVQQNTPELLQSFWQDPLENPPPGGETMTDFFDRINSYWRELISLQQGKKCLLISHGGSIRCILASVLGMSLRPLSRLSVPHACLSRIEIFHQAGSDDWPQLSFHRPLPRLASPESN